MLYSVFCSLVISCFSFCLAFCFVKPSGVLCFSFCLAFCFVKPSGVLLLLFGLFYFLLLFYFVLIFPSDIFVLTI